MTSPTGDQICTSQMQAASSGLNSIKLSDNMRHTQEIQSVGCNVSSASDHTFQAIKNYIIALIFGALAIHTITVETGEIASAVIISTTEAHHFGHAIVQFSRQSNVKPRMHVVDNYPTNSELFKVVFGSTYVLRLGLFHFVQQSEELYKLSILIFMQVFEPYRLVFIVKTQATLRTSSQLFVTGLLDRGTRKVNHWARLRMKSTRFDRARDGAITRSLFVTISTRSTSSK